MFAGYNGDLANNLGNLVSRVMKLKEKTTGAEEIDPVITKQIETTTAQYHEAIKEFKFHEALAKLWELYTFGNVYINEKAPWKTGDMVAVTSTAHLIAQSAPLLEPFLPETAEKIKKSMLAPSASISLFPRL